MSYELVKEDLKIILIENDSSTEDEDLLEK
jgi:hypothetical protein